MALNIFGATRCPLCGELIGESTDIYATTHFIDDESHPLCRYSDSVMHRRCFAVWKDRRAFVEKYIEELNPKWLYRIRWLYLWAVMAWLTRR